MPKTILHFIFDLGRGGAETMLVRVLKELKEYRNIVVTLYGNNHFGEELECDEYINLQQPFLLSFPSTAKRLKHIVETRKVDLVHSHLFWPTIIARLGVPKHIPLLTTIHAFIKSSLEYKHGWVRWLDRFTFRKRKSIIIGVCQGALREYLEFHQQPQQSGVVIYTFADLSKFSRHRLPKENREGLKLVSVGALRKQKDQAVLIDALTRIEKKNITLDIYGSGPLEFSLQKQIGQTGAQVRLVGETDHIEELLPQYDILVMSSIFEGFSLAVLEAMAIGLPLLLSDIPSFREQCGNTALYFPVGNARALAKEIGAAENLMKNYESRAQLAQQRVRDNFSLENHLLAIRNLYQQQLEK
ncbi:MAG: glycosyltransferase [Chitinophagaceae bacterium]|nr:glycosyltransferase [Chitinophagaceae bacterium]